MDAPQAAGSIPGHNRPPLAELLNGIAISDVLAELFGPVALAEANAKLFEEIGGAVKEAAALGAVSDQASHDKAADMVRKLRGLINKAEDARTATKKPFLETGKAVDAFFKEIPDPAKPNGVGGHKARLEGLVGSWVRAEAERKRAEAAAAAEEQRKRAQAEAEAAAKLEAAGSTGAAEAVMGAALQSDDAAARLQKAADGSNSDLARTRTEAGTSSGLRKVLRINVSDEAALRATLGKLGPHLSDDALMTAIRSFAAAEKLEGRFPALNGVVFRVEEVANVR